MVLGMKTTNSWVYFLRCGEYVKMGISRNVLRRLHDTSNQIPFPVDIAFEKRFVLANRKLGEIRRRFEVYRHRGEWYKIPADVLAGFIAEDHAEPVRPTPKPKVEKTSEWFAAQPWYCGKVARKAVEGAVEPSGSEGGKEIGPPVSGRPYKRT